jgi:hypothetical protein
MLKWHSNIPNISSEELKMNHATTLTIKPISSRATISAMLLTLLALILLVTPALAAVPVEGVVYEGKSVPGAALGATRAQVVKNYGEPMLCNDTSTSKTYICTFKVEGGGTVDVSFIRSIVSPIPRYYDTVSFIRWSQELGGWKTTAGINTDLALTDPKAVVKAYPQATVRYNAFGQIVQVRDGRLGIQVDWLTLSSSKDIQPRVSMAIFSPTQITFLDN